MGFLTALGVNETIFVQFGLFLVTFVILYYLVFKPYYAASKERGRRTVGSYEFAERLIDETKDLEQSYEKKAREMNSQFKYIYDVARSEALREYDKVVAESRAKAKALIEKYRDKVNAQLEGARQDLDREIPAVSNTVVSKMLGKDLNA